MSITPTPQKEPSACTLPDAFLAISGKWKPYIIWHLSISKDFTLRYGALKRTIPWPVSHKVFTQQLRELEDDGLITRTTYDEKPTRVEYTLTDAAMFLVPVVYYMRDWGALYGRHAKEFALERTHGSWVGNEIKYEYHDKESQQGLQIIFNVNRPRRKRHVSSDCGSHNEE